MMEKMDEFCIISTALFFSVHNAKPKGKFALEKMAELYIYQYSSFFLFIMQNHK